MSEPKFIEDVTAVDVIGRALEMAEKYNETAGVSYTHRAKAAALYELILSYEDYEVKSEVK